MKFCLHTSLYESFYSELWGVIVEKDPAIFEDINYYVTCHLIFPKISYIYVVKRVI